MTIMTKSDRDSSNSKPSSMASSAQTIQFKQYKAMDQKKLSKMVTYRSESKMITLIALLLLHLFPTGPPYDSMQGANFGNPKSSNSKYKATITLKINSKTMIKSTAIKILNTMKQADITKGSWH
jgi:hypothetical protein